MIRRNVRLPPEHIYPIDDWRIVERRFSMRYLEHNETIFAIGNGYLGMRGNLDDGRPIAQSGTYINGFYESWPITYAEEAYGFAKTGQTMLNVTDGKIIRLYVDDEPLFLPTATLLSYERALDMAAGTLDRELVWEMPSGKLVKVASRRLASFRHRHLAAISFEVTVMNADAPVVISSELITPENNQSKRLGDPRAATGLSHSVFEPKLSFARDRRIGLGYVTANSRMSLAVSAEHVLETASKWRVMSESDDYTAKTVFSVDAEAGQPITLIKYLSYHKSRTEQAPELSARSDRTLNRAADAGFDHLIDSQRTYMDEFWRRSDVVLQDGDPRVQQCVRFNLFHILQAAGRAEGSGIPAKGLTGPAYDGHYFWDIEIYILPFLIYTSPRIARNLLKFRYGQLDAARARARQVNQKGALFPWRTINGEEASAYFAAGTAQYHINADVVYALKKYVEVTGDEDFLFEFGAEILVETARFWADLGAYPNGNDSSFHIHGVTGPDEYTAIVNDNAYTNLMARSNLRYAAEIVDRLAREDEHRFAALVHATGLSREEVEEWRGAADRMHVPYDEELGVHPQDSSFLDKPAWDFENTPPDHYPLFMFYHPLVIYRHRVIKQSDVVLAMFLLGEEFSLQSKRRNFDYYSPLTTWDSSLSVSIQSIAAWELDYRDMANEFFRYTALMDLADVGGNVKDGVHVASLGGTWMAVVYGLAGMRDYGGALSFDPRSADDTVVKFRLIVRGQEMEVAIEGPTVTYLLRRGSGLTIRHRDEAIELAEGEPVARPTSLVDESHGERDAASKES